jgi:hypothetical protein
VSGVLERSTPPRPVEVEEGDAPTVETADADATGGRSRSRRPAVKPGTRKPKARTVYLDDNLFERIIVQAHRRGRTISEYVSSVLERQVPDHRVMRGDAPDTDAA